jgi:hypothetical protein
MSFLKIIKAFHKQDELLINLAIRDIEEIVNKTPEDIDDLVQFALSNLNEMQFIFLYSIIEECCTSCSLNLTARSSFKFSLFFILLKTENIQDSDPDSVNEFQVAPTLRKFKLLKNRNDYGFFVPHINNAKLLSDLPIYNFHMYFRNTMESIPYLPSLQLHDDIKLRNEELICIPLIIQEKEKKIEDPEFLDLYYSLSERKRKLLNKELSVKFSKQQNKYQVLDNIPALDVKGLFYEEDPNQ